MAEYIEREAVIAELAKGTIITDDLYGMGIMSGVDFAMKKIAEFPAADVAPVVRCGECERRSKSADLTDSVYCPWLKLQMRKTDFCSYGERKDGEG